MVPSYRQQLRRTTISRFDGDRKAHRIVLLPTSALISARRTVVAHAAVYTVRYAGAVYVLHAFQKKSKKRIATPKAEFDFDRKTSERPDQGKGATTMTKRLAARDPARNVWLQLGFPDAEEHYLKAELVLRLDKAITSLGLTQRAAARRIGTTQPELSKILGGKFTEVSLERLMRFLTALGCHIEIKIGAGRENKAGDVTIKDVRRTAA
jgi:predicted XRE-type DNA-binding protein